MNKLFKTLSIASISALSILAITSCGKKKKDKTTTEAPTTVVTTTADTKKEKTGFTVNVNNSITDVTYKLYSVIDGKKNLVNNDTEFKKDDKVIIEIINRNTSNMDIKALSSDVTIIDTTVKSKAQTNLDVITINNDVDLTITKSNKYYIDFNNTDNVTFKAHYFDNGVKKEFTDDFTIDKKTKIYFTMINDSTGANMGYIKNGSEYLDTVKCLGKGGHNPVIGEFDSEGYDIESNIQLLSYYTNWDDEFSAPLYIYSEDVTLSFVDATTSETLNIIPSSWHSSVTPFTVATVTISNPNKKHLIMSFESVDGLKKVDTSDETFSFNYKFNSTTYMEVNEYTTFSLSLTNNNADVYARLYTYDNDNIQYDLNNGNYPIYQEYYFELVNYSKYDLNIAVREDDTTDYYTVHAFETIDLSNLSLDPSLYENVEITVNKTENETKFYIVTYDDTNTPEGLDIRLGLYRGMYDYPNIEFGTSIVAGTELAAVCEDSVGGYSLKIINADTDKEIDSDTIGGSCAITFTLNSNIKLVVVKN